MGLSDKVARRRVVPAD